MQCGQLLEKERAPMATGYAFSSESDLLSSANTSALSSTTPSSADLENEAHKYVLFTKVDIFFALFSIGMVLSDHTTDILSTVNYLYEGELRAGLATLAIVLISCVCVQSYSYRLHREEKLALREEGKYVADERLWRCFRWISHCFPFAIIYRYILILKMGRGIRSKVREGASYAEVKEDYKTLSSQMLDVCKLHVNESFTESTSQILVQLYIIVTTEKWNFLKVFTIVTSICSLSWSVVNFATASQRFINSWELAPTRGMRGSQTLAQQRPCPVLVLHVVWTWMILAFSIAALLLFSITFDYYVLLAFGVQWVVTTLWLKTVLHRSFFFTCLLGVVYCFCHLTFTEDSSPFSKRVFYSFIVLRNLVLMIVSMLMDQPQLLKPKVIIFAFAMGCMFLGFVGMFWYYRKYHRAGPVTFRQQNSGCSVTKCSKAKENLLDSCVQVDLP